MLGKKLKLIDHSSALLCTNRETKVQIWISISHFYHVCSKRDENKPFREHSLCSLCSKSTVKEANMIHYILDTTAVKKFHLKIMHTHFVWFRIISRSTTSYYSAFFPPRGQEVPAAIIITIFF